jgi:hypothetical protein
MGFLNKIKGLFKKEKPSIGEPDKEFKPKLKLVLIDIDGVIYDFVSYMLKTHFSFINADETMIRNYDISTSIGISKSDFWRTCDKADGIFHEGEIYEWTKLLIDICKSHADKVAFSSNPGNNPKHWAEKKKFYDKFFTDSEIPMITTQHKESLSLEGVVLIDDFDKNIKKFNELGNGIGITFPQYWNSNNSDHLIANRLGYIDCTLDDIRIMGFEQWKKGNKND